MSEERRIALAGLIIALVVATLLLLSNKPVAPEPVLFMKPVPVEGITARRLDEGTFRARWLTVAELPPATVIHEISVPAEPAEATVTSPPPAWSPPPARLVKRAALRTGVCARHGMRKVTYGKRWRCRK